MEDTQEIGPTDQPPQSFPQKGRKRSNQITGSSKKQKDQKPQVVYTLTDDDLEKIGY
jgi:hypothetical protein